MKSIFFLLLCFLNINFVYGNHLLDNFGDHETTIEQGESPEYTVEPDMYNDNIDLSLLRNVNRENNLRNDLFVNYNKNTIPVRESSDTINLLFGLNIGGLVSFDQKAEKINLNILTTLIWEDQYLRWDQDLNPEYPDYIIVSNKKIWQPDLELYNAGSQPQIFETSGTSKLYSNGVVIYNRPTSYTFACKLSLENFPFDTQVCDMTFGSWKYPKATLNLRPFKYDELYNSFMNVSLEDFLRDKNITTPRKRRYESDDYEGDDFYAGESVIDIWDFWIDDDYESDITNELVQHLPIFLQDLRKIKNITVSDSFSHNEWNIINVSVDHQDIEYKCCPGDVWPNTKFSITLQRNPNKYIVSIIMAVFITFSSLVVNLLNLTQYRRTYILVFIPLTLIWLQIHTSSKVPVIEYATKLENIIQLCFYTTIISAFESGIIYSLLLNRFKYFEPIFRERVFKHMEVIGKYKSVVIKHPNSDNIDNKYFKVYSYYLQNIDNIFRILITLIFVIYFCVVI
jgi:hypothetical protein